MVKKIFFSAFFTLSFFPFAFAQSEKPFPIDEFSISGNWTAIPSENGNSKSRIGFGLGLYKYLSKGSKFVPQIGLEYTETRQFRNSIIDHPFRGSANTILKLNTLSVPLSLNIKFGDKTKFLLEPGVFGDLTLQSKRDGTFYFKNTRTFVVSSREETRYLSTKKANFGISLNLGFCFPAEETQLVIKAGYKYGFNNLSLSPAFNVYNRYFFTSIAFSSLKPKLTQGSKPFPIDEFSILINRTAVNTENENWLNRNGFGLGVYKNLAKGSKLIPQIGLEYNETRQFNALGEFGHLSSSSRLTYQIKTIALPFSMNFRTGNKIQFLFEPGIYGELTLNSTKNGSFPIYDSLAVLIDYEEDKKVLQTDAGNFGASLKLGLSLQVGANLVLLKTGYKHGFNNLSPSSHIHIFNRYFFISMGTAFNQG